MWKRSRYRFILGDAPKKKESRNKNIVYSVCSSALKFASTVAFLQYFGFYHAAFISILSTHPEMHVYAVPSLPGPRSTFKGCVSKQSATKKERKKKASL